MTVLAFERYAVDPEATASAEAWLGTLCETIRTQPGALWADASAAFDDRPSYLVLSEWRTEADLDAWESSETFSALAEEVDPWLREAPVRRRFTSP